MECAVPSLNWFTFVQGPCQYHRLLLVSFRTGTVTRCRRRQRSRTGHLPDKRIEPTPHTTLRPCVCRTGHGRRACPIRYSRVDVTRDVTAARNSRAFEICSLRCSANVEDQPTWKISRHTPYRMSTATTAETDISNSARRRAWRTRRASARASCSAAALSANAAGRMGRDPESSCSDIDLSCTCMMLGSALHRKRAEHSSPDAYHPSATDRHVTSGRAPGTPHLHKIVIPRR